MIEKVDSRVIPIDSMITSLCKIPYYGHNKGCVNHGKKEGCPPGILSLEDIFDLNQEIFVIYTRFPVGEFAEKMRLTHPDWKEQIYLDNPRYSERVKEIKEKLMERNPYWKINYFSKSNPKVVTSSREWYNPRRWQGSARKNHREEFEKIIDNNFRKVNGELKRALKIFFNPSLGEKSEMIKNGLLDFGDYRINKCPEAHGVNVTGLMAEIGVSLSWGWPPAHSLENQTYIVSFLGKKK